MARVLGNVLSRSLGETVEFYRKRASVTLSQQRALSYLPAPIQA